MSVAKTHRRLGIGKLLMDTVFKNARLLADESEPANIFLSTSEFQIPAINFYKSYGFNNFFDLTFSLLPGIAIIGHYFHKRL